MKKLTCSQIFGIIWGGFGGLNIITASGNGMSDTALGFVGIFNCIIFVIPGILLFHVCKKRN